jgi:glycosyl transferase family 25
MNFIDHFDQIRIINLPKRTDRRREMDKELSDIGMTGDPRVAYTEAQRPADPGKFTSIGARGVYESHKKILREAAAANTSVLILEDDCAFVAGARSYQLSDGWDIFYGGYLAAHPHDLQNSDIIGAHIMGFSRKGAKVVSAYLENLDYDGIHPPIDAAYIWFRRAYPDVPTHFAVPPIAFQRSSRSDIADLKWFDRTPVVRTMANTLRSLIRKKPV